MSNDAGVGQAGFGFGEVTAEPLTREQVRSRRKRAVRAKTISVKRMTKRAMEEGRLMYPEEDNGRPKTRGECPPVDDDGKRRCAFVSCEWHLYLDVSDRTGAIKLNYPDIEDPTEIPECCTLDVIDRGGVTLEQVGAIMNLTRERIRQLEVKALGKLLASDDANVRALAEYLDAPAGKRRLPVIRSAEMPQYRRGYEPPTPGAHSAVESPMGWRVSPGVRSVGLSADASDLPGTGWEARERTLRRVAERLGRATAVGLLRASGLPADDPGPVHRMAAAGLIRREGDEYVWVGQQAAAE